MPEPRRRRWLAASLLSLGLGAMMASDAAPAGWAVQLLPIQMSGIAEAERVAWLPGPGPSNAMVFALPTGRTGMQLVRLDGQAPPAVLAAFPSWCDWDLGAATGGLQLIHTEAASAVVSLETRRLPNGASEPVNRHLDFAVFGEPRFVRRAAAGWPLPLAAMALLGSPKQASAVAFLPDTDGGYRPHQVLPTLGEGRVLAVQLLSRPAGGFVMLALLARPLEPAREGAAAAVVVAQRLDERLQAAGAPWRPLGDTVVYQFDADLAGERLLVFASTARGWALGAGDRQAQGDAVRLRSPIVAAEGDAIRLAVLAGEPGAVRLMGARVALPP